MTTRLSILLIVFLAFTSCEKKIFGSKTNPSNQSSKHFRCSVNGVPWEAGTPTWYEQPAFETYYNEQTGAFQIIATRRNQEATFHEAISIYIPIVTGVGQYETFTHDDEGNMTAFRDYKGNYPCPRYSYLPGDPGIIDITMLDTVNNIVKGTFHLTAHPVNFETQNLDITDGSFAVGYY